MKQSSLYIQFHTEDPSQTITLIRARISLDPEYVKLQIDEDLQEKLFEELDQRLNSAKKLYYHT